MEKYSSLLALETASDPEGRYMFARVKPPMSKTITLPLVSKRRFSGESSDLMIVAVPYLLTALLEMMLNSLEMVLQLVKESSEILIS